MLARERPKYFRARPDLSLVSSQDRDRFFLGARDVRLLKRENKAIECEGLVMKNENRVDGIGIGNENDGLGGGREEHTCLFPARWPPRTAVLDQNVARADFLRFRLQKRRSRERIDLLPRQAFWRLPDRLLRDGVVEIWQTARIREANFPVRLQAMNGSKI